MSLLQQMGYQDVRHFAGGIQGWRSAGLPFDQGDDRSVEPERRPRPEMAGAPA